MEKRYETPSLEALFSRRSVRRYEDRAVEEDKLETVIQAGLFAASGGNHQTSRFTVILRREILQELTILVREVFREMEYVEGAYHNTAVLNARNHPDYDFCHHAPALVIASARNCWPNGMADCACSLENMQIAAAAVGLGSCWVNQLHWLTDNRRLRAYLSELGFGEDETVYGSLALGHPVLPIPRAAPRRENRVTYVR